MVQMASLDLVQWYDNSFEEVDMLLSQWHSKSTDDTCQDVEKFCRSIEFEILMNECIEAIGDGLSDHLSSWDEFCIQSMQNVLQVLALSWFF
jgi:hypothetical protein